MFAARLARKGEPIEADERRTPAPQADDPNGVLRRSLIAESAEYQPPLRQVRAAAGLRGASPRRGGLLVVQSLAYSAGVALTGARSSTGMPAGCSRRRNRRNAIRMSLNRRTQAFGFAKWDANSRFVSSGTQ